MVVKPDDEPNVGKRSFFYINLILIDISIFSAFFNFQKKIYNNKCSFPHKVQSVNSGQQVIIIISESSQTQECQQSLRKSTLFRVTEKTGPG